MLKYDVRKNWISTVGFMKAHPVALMPFVVIAFLEALALEGVYFATRFPISVIADPIIKKFFGEALVHYPGNIMLLPQIFYYKQIGIYIVFSVFLTAMSVNIYHNIRLGLPLKANALVKNALSRYFAFAGFGVILMALTLLLQKVDGVLLAKAMRVGSKFLPKVIMDLSPLWSSALILVSTILLFMFTLTAIPLMVLEKKSLLKAILGAIAMGFKNFFALLGLMALPFLLYLPMVFLKGSTGIIMDKTFPEVAVIITAAGILIAIFIDSFVILSLSQFVMDRKK